VRFCFLAMLVAFNSDICLPPTVALIPGCAPRLSTHCLTLNGSVPNFEIIVMVVGLALHIPLRFPAIGSDSTSLATP